MSLQFLLACALITYTISAMEQEQKFKFFALPHELQNEIMSYVPSTDFKTLMIMYHNNFQLSEKLAYKIVDDRVNVYMHALNDECVYDTRKYNNITYSHDFTNFKKKLLKGVGAFYCPNNRPQKGILLDATRKYCSHVAKQQDNEAFPEFLKNNGCFTLQMPMMSNYKWENITSIIPDQETLDSSLAAQLLKILLMIDKLEFNRAYEECLDAQKNVHGFRQYTQGYQGTSFAMFELSNKYTFLQKKRAKAFAYKPKDIIGLSCLFNTDDESIIQSIIS